MSSPLSYPLPPGYPALGKLITALHVIDGIWMAAILVHIAVRLQKKQMQLYKLRRSDSGTIVVPQARAILAVLGLITIALEQVNLKMVTRAMIEQEVNSIVAFNSLLNWTWIPLALGAWTLCWAGLTHVVIATNRGPSALTVNVVLACILLAYIMILTPLFCDGEAHLSAMVDAYRAGDAGLEAHEFGRYRTMQQVAVGFVAAGEIIFLLIYVPTSSFYINQIKKLYRKSAEMCSEEPGKHTAGVKVPLSEIEWKRDRRFTMLFVEMCLVVCGLGCDIVTLIWFASAGAFLFSPEAFAGFLAMLHLSTTVPGILITILATVRLLIRPRPHLSSTDPWQRSTADARVDAVQTVAFSGLIEEKMARQAARFLPGTTSTTTGASTVDSAPFTDSLISEQGANEDSSWLDIRPSQP